MRPDFGLDDEPDSPDPTEQDLLVVLRLSNRQMGMQAERLQLEALSDTLEAALQEAGVGEYDGDELGGGECVLFFCGPDTDAMIEVLRPLLHRSPIARGGHFVRMRDDGEQERLPI